MQRFPIMAIHGSASSGAIWRSLKEQCAGQRTVFTPDLMGYGKAASVALPERPSLAYRASPLVKGIRRHGPVHLVAHSFGSSVALEILRTIPHCILSLTFYEPVLPAIFKGGQEEQDMKFLGDFVDLSRLVSGASPSVGMESFINFWDRQGAWNDLPEIGRNKLLRAAPMVYRDFQEAISQPEGIYETIECRLPTQIFVGQTTQPHARRMADLLLQTAIPHGELTIMDGMGHMGPATHTQTINGAILRHVQESETRAMAA
ncbi:alpha/beta hydrolase [Marinobacter salinisoli]|uniref:Alpha/beta hydrolase n=1 Tax=Marinobacter salinisoli TaxID=2769486 RepID=A0ABX7MTS2_9GAMM|nr:alpha/beta hydrolase [Marinobacter salinisoli]QSP94892.1 alpha/beta hydrolase [Marinobacter salinisoli]